MKRARLDLAHRRGFYPPQIAAKSAARSDHAMTFRIAIVPDAILPRPCREAAE
jgi:hypothetical protein